MPKISIETRLEKRELIIQCALKLFSEKGYSNTTMDDIVASCGISKGGIYNYFKSKEEIFLAIAEWRFKKRHDFVDILSKESNNKEKIIKYIQYTFDSLTGEDTLLNVKFIFEFWSVVSRNKDIPEINKERYGLYSSDLSVILKAGVENGEFRQDLDIPSTVYIILSSTDGIAFFVAVMNIQMPENLIKNHIDMILNNIINKEATYDNL